MKPISIAEMMQLKQVTSDKDYNTGIELFKEYAIQIGVDLTFQNFDDELKDIKNQYGRPSGALIIAYDKDCIPQGCIGVRKLDDDICELKRMYLRKCVRGLGLGKQLLMKSIEVGGALGYKKMRLDTLPTMQTAIALYKKTGFYEIAPYRFNPISGTIYMETLLT